MSHSDTVTQWLFQKLIVLDRSKVDSLGAFQPSFVTMSPEVLHLYCPSYSCHTVTKSHSDKVTQWLFKKLMNYYFLVWKSFFGTILIINYQLISKFIWNMSEAKKAKSGGERMRKYREEVEEWTEQCQAASEEVPYSGKWNAWSWSNEEGGCWWWFRLWWHCRFRWLINVCKLYKCKIIILLILHFLISSYQLPPSLHIIMSSHYHIATDPKITWRTLSQKYPENVTVWHGSSME